MKIHEELAHVILQQNFLLATIAVLAIFGTMLEIISLIWDSSSHITQDTDEFWRIHHIAVYSGAGMITISALIGLKFLIKRHPNNKIRNGIKLIIIGTGVQLFSGYMDSISHYFYGIDGKISITHTFGLEASLIPVAIGGFIILNQLDNDKTKKLIPFAIFTILAAIFPVFFDFVLLIAGPIICAHVFEILSYGCAIL
ncbi:hypothetical protein MnTg01_01203 [archaeon MnTg01]|nr:hypothetical protein MnTg01_01203 [archaeon MnTg01]